MKPFILARLLPLLTLIMALSGAAMAQTGGPTPGTPPVTDPTTVPLDGGVSLLLAGGVAYGIKHLRNRRQKA
ncbi:MAG TPA: hypothetical protein VF690_20220 [Hymenobacter sp.]|jgi:hypothetical protein